MFRHFGIILVFLSFPAISQSIIWHESFESDGEGTRYFSSSTFYDGANDHFRVSDGSDISITGGSYSGYEGLFFWAGEDFDDAGDPENDGSATKEVVFKGINTSGYTNLKFYGLFAAGNDGSAGSNAYDDEDSVVIYYSTDHGSFYIKALKFASMGDQSNEPLALDSDLNGVGDNIVLTPEMQGFSFPIPDTDDVKIKISLSMNAGNEEIAFDNFRITGEHDGTSPLPSAVSFGISSDTISESAGEYSLPIYFENPSDSIDIVIQIQGDSSKISHFEEELTLIAQEDSVVTHSIGIAGNESIDGLSKLIFHIAEISGGYEPYVKEPSSFTLYVLDDDLPEGGEVIISEIMYDSKSSVDEEWVELYNTTTLPINISGWYLTDDDSYPADQEGDVTIPDETFIYPGEYLVLSWSDLRDFDEEVLADKNSGFRSYAPGLANTGDNLALYSNATGTGILVDGSDSAFYSDVSPANAGYSIERDPVKGYSGTWRSSRSGYGGTEIIRGTPGAVNSTQYTAISFALPSRLVSEDSSSVLMPLKIINPSDTNSTHLEVIIIDGDTSKLHEASFTTITFPAGTDTHQFLQVDIKDDDIVGNTDTLVFKINDTSGGLNAYVARDSLFHLIIKDNDLTRVDFQLDSVGILEGDSVEINLVLTNPHPELETSVLVNGDTGDLLLSVTELTFPPGGNNRSISVKAFFDGIVEGDEYTKLKIAQVSGGKGAFAGVDSTIVVKIIDDHPTTVLFLYENDTVSESDGSFYIPAVINHPSQDSATAVEVRLTNGGFNDLKGFTNEQVIFPLDEADTIFLEIPVFNDSIREGTEKFTFELTEISGGHYSRIAEPATFTLIITDDEEEVYNIILNELLFDPPADSVEGDANNDGIRSSIEDEFIELVNLDSLSIDISGFTINDATNLQHVFPEGTVVAPRQGVVVFGGGSPVGDFGESIIQTASSGGLSFNNGGDYIYLINNSDTLLSSSYSGSLGNDQSITRFPDLSGEFADHLSVSEQLYSPGYQVNGLKFSEKLPDPFILLDTNFFDPDFGAVYFTDTSEVQSYKLSAGNLQDSLFITVPSGFEISTDGVNWFMSGNMPAIYSSDSLEVEIFVRFIPNVSADKTFEGKIRHSTLMADTTSAFVTGWGLKKPEPKITINPAMLDFGVVTGNLQDNVVNYKIYAEELIDTLLIKAPQHFSISTDNNDFFDKLKLLPDDGAKIDATIFVRLDQESEGIYQGELVHGTAWLDTVKVFIEGEFIIPVIEVDQSQLEFKDYYIPEEPEVLSYTLTAHSIEGELKIFPPPGFELALENDFNNPADSLLLQPDNRKIIETIYVRFNTDSTGIFYDSIRHSAYGADNKFVVITGVADKITSISNDRSHHTTIKVYPIPADNYINIETATNSHKNVRLSNAVGQEMLSLEFSQNVRLDTSLLERGLYYLHISSGEEMVKIKVVIVH